MLFGCIAAGGALMAQLTELPPAANRRVDFSVDIEPILVNRCKVCHGAEQQMNGLRLDRREDALRGSHSGAVILPGNSAESKLIHMVAEIKKGMVMPPVGERLTAGEIGILRAWIDQGAEWPPAATSAEPSADRPTFTHWAVQPLRRPRVPPVRNSAWVKNPIDNFILAKLEAEGIEPSRQAEKRTLVRRLSLDLIGLPPTPQEVAEFLADDHPNAYERLVDRLLKSRHHGEKWAMHWLDLARYADSDGYESDRIRPYAWRYRHWVIEALNQDMPFDQFTIEQISGDLLPGATVEQHAAAGFHRNTLKNREGGTKLEQFRFEETVDRTNTVGTVWLGLTVGCAQCHDHKYDPLTQKEYYQLFAFFNDIEEITVDAPLPGEMGPYLAALPEYRRKREALLAEHHVPQLQPEWEQKMILAAANPGKWTDWDHAYDAFQKYLDRSDKIVRMDSIERSQKDQDALTDHFVANYHRVITHERQEELNYKELRKKLQELEDDFPVVSQALTVSEDSDARNTHIHIRGDWRNKGIPVEPKTPSFLPAMADDPNPSRLTLARWLISPDNPLTVRVTVNRIWQEYFGTGLVKTSEDFGVQGEEPSHPELLDWLAASFIERGWSMKQMHKLIVMSATYRQSSKARPELDSRDPNNSLLARQSRLRLPAELIRDAALSVSGLLYPAIGGRSIQPPRPDTGAKLAISFRWQESQGKDRYRRGLYVLRKRTAPYPQLMNFDAPESNVTVCRRDRSNTPLQSLNLLNDPVFMETARALAVRVLRESDHGLQERLRYAFELCLTREPEPDEVEALLDYYTRKMRILEEEPESVEELLPLNLAGISQVQGAAWVGLGSVLLNLDEFITRE